MDKYQDLTPSEYDDEPDNAPMMAAVSCAWTALLVVIALAFFVVKMLK